MVLPSGGPYRPEQRGSGILRRCSRFSPEGHEALSPERAARMAGAFRGPRIPLRVGQGSEDYAGQDARADDVLSRGCSVTLGSEAVYAGLVRGRGVPDI